MQVSKKFQHFKQKISEINSNNWKIIALVLTVKCLILVFGYLAHLALSDNKLNGSYWYLGIWNRWDSKHYLNIAINGYSNVGDKINEIVFFPLYPTLVGILYQITGEEVLSAFIVSGISSVVLGVLFYQLVRLDFTKEIGISSVWFLFIFPTSYFLHIPYTESLFLALVIGGFLYSRKENWFMAGMLGFLACLSRLNGLIILLVFLFEIYLIWSKTKKFDIRWLWILFIPFGFVFYLWLNYMVSGDAFTFLNVQLNNWNKYLSYPWVGIWKQILLVYGQKEPIAWFFAFQELFFVGIGFVSIIWGWRYFNGSYRIWMVANWLLFISTSWVLSVPRYTLTMFPIFILFGIVTKNWYLRVVITTWSFLFLSLFIISFVQGRWGF